MNYSVLMSVYYKENPEFLRQSIESIINQSAPTDDFVLVCDGPLNEQLDNVIFDMQKRMGSAFNVVRLKKNVGLGRSLNEGIRYCRNEIIARMDSDDISMKNRCEKQLKLFETLDVEIVGGAVEEFEHIPGDTKIRRKPPEKNEEIIDFAKKRNPFNHPCVMYKKSAVEKAGGYQNFYLLEDYYLWLRMLMNGSKGYNIQEPILWMRAGRGMYKRRAGLKYANSQRKLFCFMKTNNFITAKECYVASTIRTVSAIAPNCIRKRLFEKFLRK